MGLCSPRLVIVTSGMMFLWRVFVGRGWKPSTICPLAQSGISWLQSLLFRCSPLSPVLVCRYLLFGFSLDELRVVPRVLVYALNVLKYFIWLARFNLPVLYRRFKSSRRRRYFHRQWDARGVLAAVDDGLLILKI